MYTDNHSGTHVCACVYNVYTKHTATRPFGILIHTLCLSLLVMNAEHCVGECSEGNIKVMRKPLLWASGRRVEPKVLGAEVVLDCTLLSPGNQAAPVALHTYVCQNH